MLDWLSQVIHNRPLTASFTSHKPRIEPFRQELSHYSGFTAVNTIEIEVLPLVVSVSTMHAAATVNLVMSKRFIISIFRALIERHNVTGRQFWPFIDCQASTPPRSLSWHSCHQPLMVSPRYQAF